MNIAIVYVTEEGRMLSQRIAESMSVSILCCKTFDKAVFNDYDGIVFICACGIAVRAIAPLIKSKLTDPAVVVCDETGQFAVSLLSGHAGGANSLAARVAEIIGATPVVTTASDCHTKGIPQPKNLVLGIGCRRGLSAETIGRAVTIMLWDFKIPLNRVRQVATIDIKQDESGLIGFAEAHELPLHFFTAKELTNIKGKFTSSEWVSRTVGVDNVCERSAVLSAIIGGGKGQLIVRKIARDGVTIAVFEKEGVNE